MSPSKTESWAVTVERNGESVVTLASNCMGGRDISDEDERVIRLAADHLLSFIGAASVEAPRAEARQDEIERVLNDWQQNDRHIDSGWAAVVVRDLLSALSRPASQEGQK